MSFCCVLAVCSFLSDGLFSLFLPPPLPQKGDVSISHYLGDTYCVLSVVLCIFHVFLCYMSSYFVLLALLLLFLITPPVFQYSTYCPFGVCCFGIYIYACMLVLCMYIYIYTYGVGDWERQSLTRETGRGQRARESKRDRQILSSAHINV